MQNEQLYQCDFRILKLYMQASTTAKNGFFIQELKAILHEGNWRYDFILVVLPIF